MKKILTLIFSFFFASAALVGGCILLSGCDSSYSDPSNDSGGGIRQLTKFLMILTSISQMKTTKLRRMTQEQ